MATNTENPYANYHIDDWNWEFLRRNQRYKRAYKAVQWLKARPRGNGGRLRVREKIARRYQWGLLLHVGYVDSASRIADRRMILAG